MEQTWTECIQKKTALLNKSTNETSIEAKTKLQEQIKKLEGNIDLCWKCIKKSHARDMAFVSSAID